MDVKQVDVAIIGAGTGGLNARREVEKAGKSWVLIEGGPYGTTCARVGCMPSKLLIAAADAAHNIESSSMFGVRVREDGWEVDGPAVMERVRSERDRFTGFVVDSTEEIPEEKRLRGWARFVDPTTLMVDDHTRVEAETVVIATGSTPWVPPQLEGIRDHVITSDEIFELEDLPESMAVFGTGIIGLELGQSMARLGVRVTFFNPFEELGIFTDPRLIEKANEVFPRELDLHLGVQGVEVARRDGQTEISWSDRDGVGHNARFEVVLAAAGRRPNIDRLDLENAHIDRGHHGIPDFDQYTMQCGESPIFIAGDVSGHRPLLHEASEEGRIAGANAARYPEVESSLRKVPVAIAFTHPQMALVGQNFSSLHADEISVGEVSYDNQGRARVMGVNSGLVRVYGDRSNCRLIGAEMFGPRVEHTAHLLAWAIQRGATVPELLRMPFYHPVFEEGIRTALRDLAGQLRVQGHCAPGDRGESAGM
ncbi:MAG: dihydrolipoyl dehydrogenase [Myxococcota bacterium]